MMDSLGIPAEAIPVRSNSVAVIQATTYMCKLFYGVSQELFIWIKDLFLIGHEVSRKKNNLKVSTGRYCPSGIGAGNSHSTSYNDQITEQFVYPTHLLIRRISLHSTDGCL